MKDYIPSQIDKPKASKIAWEIGLGTISAFVGYMLSALLLRNLPRIFSSAMIIVVFLITAITASLVVYFIGKIGKYRSSYLFTLLGSVLGIGIYMGIIFIMNALGLCPS